LVNFSDFICINKKKVVTLHAILGRYVRTRTKEQYTSALKDNKPQS
jgi:hypothetical protein